MDRGCVPQKVQHLLHHLLPIHRSSQGDNLLVRSFRRGSLNNGRYGKSASRDERDASFTTGDWGSEESTTFPFPFWQVGTLQGGRDLQPSTIFIPPRGWGGRSMLLLTPSMRWRGSLCSSRGVGAAQATSLGRGIKVLPPD